MDCGQLWYFGAKQSCDGTEKRTRGIVEGSEGVVSRLGRDNATCLSGAV